MIPVPTPATPTPDGCLKSAGTQAPVGSLTSDPHTLTAYTRREDGWWLSEFVAIGEKLKIPAIRPCTAPEAANAEACAFYARRLVEREEQERHAGLYSLHLTDKNRKQSTHTLDSVHTAQWVAAHERSRTLHGTLFDTRTGQPCAEYIQNGRVWWEGWTYAVRAKSAGQAWCDAPASAEPLTALVTRMPNEPLPQVRYYAAPAAAHQTLDASRNDLKRFGF